MDARTLPYVHIETHVLEKEKFRVTIKVNKSGMKEMIIQKETNHMMFGTDENNNLKRTWLRDWSNHK